MANELTDEQKRELKNHGTDIKTFWSIYGGFQNGLIKSGYFWFSLITSILGIILFYLIDGIDAFSMIVHLNEKILSILPNIIGFNIGAYALIIGFGQKNIIDQMSIKLDDSKYTLFQHMGATFAFSVLIQSFTIMVSFFLELFIESFQKLNLCNLSISTINGLNGFIFYMLLFLSIYSVVLIPKIVLNVFGFSQLYHYYNKYTDSSED